MLTKVGVFRVKGKPVALATLPTEVALFLGTVTYRPDLGGFKAHDDDGTGVGIHESLDDAVEWLAEIAADRDGSDAQ